MFFINKIIEIFKVAEKPQPVKIAVDEVLKKVHKTSKNKIKVGLANIDKNSKIKMQMNC